MLVFFGLPLAALLLLRDGHTIGYAAICRRDAIGARRLIRALGADRVSIVPDCHSVEVLDRVRSLRPDLLVSWFWTTQFPPTLLEIPRWGAIGVHPSLLPRHRGPDPYFWAIDAGDTITGVTAHRLEDAYDTGDILAQSSLPIAPEWNAWTLARKLDRPSLALLRATVRRFAHSEVPAGIPQDESAATDAPAPDDAMFEIRWRWDTARILRRVRAAAPWPGAFTEIGESTVVVTKARATQEYPRTLIAGEAYVRDETADSGRRAVVRTGDSALELLEGRLEMDDAIRPLKAEDFATLVSGISQTKKLA